MKFKQLKRIDLVAASQRLVKVRIGPSGDAYLSKKAYRELEEPEFLEVFYSTDDHALALKSVGRETSDSYKVHLKYRNGAINSIHINCQQLVRHMPAGDYIYDPHADNDKYVFKNEA